MQSVPFAMLISDLSATNVRVVVGGGAPHFPADASLRRGILHFSVPLRASDLIGPTTMDVQYVNEFRGQRSMRIRISPAPMSITARHAKIADAVVDSSLYVADPRVQRLDQHAPAQDIIDLDGHRLSNVGDGVAAGDASTRGQLLSTMQNVHQSCASHTAAVLHDRPVRSAATAVVSSVRLDTLSASGPVDASGERVVRVGAPQDPRDMMRRGDVVAESGGALTALSQSLSLDTLSSAPVSSISCSSQRLTGVGSPGSRVDAAATRSYVHGELSQVTLDQLSATGRVSVPRLTRVGPPGPVASALFRRSDVDDGVAALTLSSLQLPRGDVSAGVVSGVGVPPDGSSATPRLYVDSHVASATSHLSAYSPTASITASGTLSIGTSAAVHSSVSSMDAGIRGSSPLGSLRVGDWLPAGSISLDGVGRVLRNLSRGSGASSLCMMSQLSSGGRKALLVVFFAEHCPKHSSYFLVPM